MARTTTVHARMDCELKENAEEILSQLGLTSSDAIKLFYKQVELNGGLPFEVKVPQKVIAEKRLLKELADGERSAEEGGWLTLEESRKKLGV
ncbi:MAG: type II toxin-antitoxin system RelB/DinJ family antitoxin [Clostridiales bacterium]|nr:type II toxin-antitoxin system RelB/DinJ family antitoxin [Clostridiales bacterium]